MLSAKLLLQRSRTILGSRILPHATSQRCRNFHWSRFSSTKSTSTSDGSDIRNKYMNKLQEAAGKKGVSLEALQEEARKATTERKPLPEADALKRRSEEVNRAKGEGNGSGESSADRDGVGWKASERRDNSPVKPLTDIMDVYRILHAPHSPEQVAALWTAFHASRSGGTGRGFLSASVPLAAYESLIHTARRFPSFIIPLLRESTTDPKTTSGWKSPEAASEQNDTSGYEFFFMQWALHPPPVLVPSSSIFQSSVTSTSSASSSPSPSTLLTSSSPAAEVGATLEHYKQATHPLATALFTPLLEYKARGTYATPHLVLTLYPEFAHTHSMVLLRGEITPSIARGGESGGSKEYLLSQHDAQMLAHGMQRFYLAEQALANIGEEQEVGRSEGSKTAAEQPDAERRRERMQLLRLFNERPEEFKWKELLKHAHPVA